MLMNYSKYENIKISNGKFNFYYDKYTEDYIEGLLLLQNNNIDNIVDFNQYIKISEKNKKFIE